MTFFKTCFFYYIVPSYTLDSWWLPVLPVIYCSFLEAQLEQTVRWTLSGSWAWQWWQARADHHSLSCRLSSETTSRGVAWTSRLVMTSWVWRTTCCSPTQGVTTKNDALTATALSVAKKFFEVQEVNGTTFTLWIYTFERHIQKYYVYTLEHTLVQ